MILNTHQIWIQQKLLKELKMNHQLFLPELELQEISTDVDYLQVVPENKDLELKN